jgi:hypothetical protein
MVSDDIEVIYEYLSSFRKNLVINTYNTCIYNPITTHCIFSHFPSANRPLSVSVMS